MGWYSIIASRGDRQHCYWDGQGERADREQATRYIAEVFGPGTWDRVQLFRGKDLGRLVLTVEVRKEV